MSEKTNATENRRRFLKLVGGSAVMMPVIGLTACSGVSSLTGISSSAPAAATPKSDAKPAMDASPKPSGMPRLGEDDMQAKAMAYVHEASTIDTAKQTRFKAGQACSNCALYQGKADDEWAGCSIFPGKAVKGTGWCTVYAPKPS